MDDPLAVAHILAEAAFDAWLEVEDKTGLGDEVGMGADGTPTTRADALLEAAILKEAEALGVSVLSEEAGLVMHGEGGPDEGWLAVVDPLDGSRNAGRGIPFHCTSIAVGRADQGLLGLQAGVVRNLVTADIFSAEKGKGASVNGEPVVRRPFDPNEVMVGVIADSQGDELLLEQDRRGHHLRDLGSAALELCLVGTGGLDAFLVKKDWLRVVDVAAGILFVREAGGLVIDPETGDDLDCALQLTVRTGVMAAHSKQSLEAVR